MNFSDIPSQSNASLIQILSEHDYLIPYIFPAGVVGAIIAYIVKQRVTCEHKKTVLQIQKNSYIRLDTYEISKPIIAIRSEKIILPFNIRHLNVSFPETDRRDIIKIEKNILTPIPWHLVRDSKTKVIIQYEWFPENNEIYIPNQDAPQEHREEIITNYTVTNCSDYDLQNLELTVNLPVNTAIDPDNFCPKFLKIIDKAEGRRIQKRATKTILSNDDLVHALEVSWEANILAGKTKTFEIHYKF